MSCLDYLDYDVSDLIGVTICSRLTRKRKKHYVDLNQLQYMIDFNIAIYNIYENVNCKFRKRFINTIILDHVSIIYGKIKN